MIKHTGRIGIHATSSLHDREDSAKVVGDVDSSDPASYVSFGGMWRRSDVVQREAPKYT